MRTATLIAVVLVLAGVLAAPAEAGDPTAIELEAAIRAVRGDAIRHDSTLATIAQRRSAEIVTNWSHDGAGAPWPWGENLAWTDAPDPVGWTIGGWLDSPGHRIVLLGDWTHVGVGVTVVDGVTYLAAVFARIPATERPTITLPPTDMER